MSKEKKLTFFLLFVFFLSRLPFINSSAVFFDSGEYLSLFAKSNFFQALYTGHFPLHIGYIIFGWPVWHLAKLLNINPGSTVILGQILLQTLAVYCLYYFISYISDRKIALISALIISLVPLFWITNEAIMMENAYVPFFCFSLYFLAKYLKKGKDWSLHLSAFFLTFTILTHLLVVLWIPFYLSVVFIKSRKVFYHTLTILVFYLVSFSLLNIFMISTFTGIAPSRVATYLYLSKQQEFALSNPSIHIFLVSIKNLVILLFTNFSGILVIIGTISVFKELRKKSKIAVPALLWIIPAYITSQFWDSLLPGRHNLIAAFGFSFLAAIFLKNKPRLIPLVFLYLLLISLPTVNLLNKTVPYLEEAKFVSALPVDSLLIETHFAKPQVESTFKGKVMAVNQSGSENFVIDRKIKENLNKNKPIFISSGALLEPYGLYSGPYLHALTLSYLHGFQLKDLATKYTLKPYKTINSTDNLYLYQLISDKPSPYPEIIKLRNSKRRIDFYDPISRALTYLIYR